MPMISVFVGAVAVSNSVESRGVNVVPIGAQQDIWRDGRGGAPMALSEGSDEGSVGERTRNPVQSGGLIGGVLERSPGN